MDIQHADTIAGCKVRLELLTHLQPIEGYDSAHILDLADIIERHGIWTEPLAISMRMFTAQLRFLIMDGHHRFQVAQMLGLVFVPVISFDYRQIEIRSLRPQYDQLLHGHNDPGQNLAETITSNGIALFPAKTVHHVLPSLPQCSYSLRSLR